MQDFNQSVSSETTATSVRNRLFRFSIPKLDKAKLKKIGSIVGVAIIVLFIAGALRLVILQRLNGQTIQVAPGTRTVDVSREFTFPVYDATKQLADPIKYSVVSAQLTKQIVIKGQPATAVAGRQFLILNLKLVNDYNKSLYLNTRNYVRVQPAGTQDKLAAEIHNDTVEVQPGSTKLTRIGLPVDEGITSFTLFVGEIDGTKQEIPVSF